MNKYDFYKENYYYQIEEKEKISTKTTIPIGVLSVLINAAIFLIGKYKLFIGNTVLLVIFIVSMAIMWGALVYATVKLLTALKKYNYKSIAKLSEISSYYSTLEKTYDDNSEYYSEQGILRDDFVENNFEKYLEQRYIEATDINLINNENKKINLHKVLRGLVLAIVCIVITFGLSVYGDVTHSSDDIVNIHIENLDKQ